MIPPTSYPSSDLLPARRRAARAVSAAFVSIGTALLLGTNDAVSATAAPKPKPTTVAGGHGKGEAANQLDDPVGVALDAAGNLYIADSGNFRVSKWAPGATVGATVVGDPTRVEESLTLPAGVAVDTAGNIFIADSGNHRVQMRARAGAITIVDGAYGRPGLGSNQLNLPVGVAVDAAGNVYIADMANNRIQKRSANGVVNTAVGDPKGNEGDDRDRLNKPHGVAVDAVGNLYVADTDNDRIQRRTPAGAISTVAGGHGRGKASQQLDRPYGVAIDTSGNVYIADTGNHRIQLWVLGATNGATIAGGHGQGSGANKLSSPEGVAVDNKGNVYISDTLNHRVRKVVTPGK